MAKINKNYKKLVAGYLFPEIAKRTRDFKEKNPDADVMRLGIGDTTEPLPMTTVAGMVNYSLRLAQRDTYKGYGDEQGEQELRTALIHHYSKRGIVNLDSSEIFISDGAKPDVANIQSIFGLENIVAVQDPAYPVYVDTNVIAGRTGEFLVSGKYNGLIYMPCTAGNNFVPAAPKEKADLIYLCFPNNPTGAVATKEQLKEFVDIARKEKSVIIFDAAYAPFIQDKDIPKSIYEIEGAKECAIEINSFSKIAGFTGVRLGWTVVPKDLVCEDSAQGELHKMWNRRQCTFFNGASNIAQSGGLAALTDGGQRECQELARYYMHNADLISKSLTSLGLRTYGGTNAPYVWMQTPDKMKSWDFFDKLLNEAHVVCTPGSGFGPCGEGYVRFSSFGHRENIEKAIDSMSKNLKL